MSSSISALSNVWSISPATFQSLGTATTAISPTLLHSMSSIVQLSAIGQVLAAGSSLETSIQSIQADQAVVTPGEVELKAQNFVTAFTQTQASISNAQPLLGRFSDSTLIGRFSQTLNAAATPVANAQTPNLASLQSIGIRSQTSVSPGTAQTVTRLTIDQRALDAAAVANPAQTLALLSKATQPLLQQVATFEVQASSPAELANLSAQNIGVPTNLLQSLPADTVLNNIQLSDLDLASVGLDAATIQLASTEFNTALVAALDAETPTPKPTQVDTAAATSLANSTTTREAATASTPPTTTANTSAVAPNASPASLPTVAATNATVNADQAASPALIATPGPADDLMQRALYNNMFSPFYSAPVATYHLNDMTVPEPAPPASAQATIPEPVSAVDKVHGINGYDETRSGFGNL